MDAVKRTSLSLKSKEVTNNSVTKYMNRLMERKMEDSNYRNRYDQSPQPNYPNFEQVKQGIRPTVKLGSIGWGTDIPTLK
jgi:hypothetical protein